MIRVSRRSCFLFLCLSEKGSWIVIESLFSYLMYSVHFVSDNVRRIVSLNFYAIHLVEILW